MAAKSAQEKLSRKLSYLLRHNPAALDLELDAEGYTQITVEELARRLGVSPQAVVDVVRHDPKGRFSVRDGRIRANYGHSIPLGRKIWEDRPPATADQLPAQLYHGTTPGRAKRILEQGLLPKGRQFVHLSTTEATAREVGLRYTPKPVLLVVDVPCARRRGVRLWVAAPTVVLSTAVPAECIRVHDTGETAP